MTEKKKSGLCTSNGNDCIRTPDDLALAIVNHFKPTGSILEPCEGGGAFTRAFHAYNEANGHPLTHIHSMEITRGTDFLNDEPPLPFYSWIITNIPWSEFTPFLKQATWRAENIVFLDKLNAWGFDGRLDILEANSYVFRRIVRVKQPPEPWPQMGMQLAAVHIEIMPYQSIWPAGSIGYLGSPTIERLNYEPPPRVIPATACRLYFAKYSTLAIRQTWAFERLGRSFIFHDFKARFTDARVNLRYFRPIRVPVVNDDPKNDKCRVGLKRKARAGTLKIELYQP